MNPLAYAPEAGADDEVQGSDLDKDHREQAGHDRTRPSYVQRHHDEPAPRPPRHLAILHRIKCQRASLAWVKSAIESLGLDSLPRITAERPEVSGYQAPRHGFTFSTSHTTATDLPIGPRSAD
ncbi:MAG: hypothetical protein ACRENX_05795 [Candidatus Dormibacteria bacterium]